MTLLPSETPLADFTRPIALMTDCHRRIEHFLGVLRRMLERYGARDLDEEGRGALETSLNYLAQAAPRHTADEELSLFPRMRRSDDPAAHEAMADLDRLEADPRRARVAHARIDRIGRRWREAGRLDGSDGAGLRALLDELAAAYADHIPLEEEHVFVLASRLLSAKSLQEVGKEIERRRLKDPGREGSRCARRRQQRQRGT